MSSSTWKVYMLPATQHQLTTMSVEDGIKVTRVIKASRDPQTGMKRVKLTKEGLVKSYPGPVYLTATKTVNLEEYKRELELEKKERVEITGVVPTHCSEQEVEGPDNNHSEKPFKMEPPQPKPVSLVENGVGEMAKKDYFEATQHLVQIASNDYLADISVEDYFARVKRYKQFTSETKQCILRLKEIREDGRLSDRDLGNEIALAMRQTHVLRYYDILHNCLSVRNTMAIYPGLQHFVEIKREFERVTKKSVDAFERHLNCVLKDYARDQLKQKVYRCSNKFCLEALNIIKEMDGHQKKNRDHDSDNDHDNDQYNHIDYSAHIGNARKTAARIMIYACAQSQRKWMDVIYKVYETPANGWICTNRPHPTVVVNGSPFAEKCADLFCEDTRILTSVDFYQAILACYYLYYVFNIDYPAIDAEAFQPFDNIMSLMELIIPDYKTDK